MDQNLDDITRGMTTKSDKIRALSRNGVPRADIARHLGIRYQHVRNVLHDEDRLSSKTKPKAPARQAPRQPGTQPVDPGADTLHPASDWLVINRDGSLSVPLSLMQSAGFEPGQWVFVGSTQAGLEVLSRRSAAQRAQALLRPLVPQGVSLATELLQERRAEAEREAAE
jgi:hypothetical protein